jgi:hypothetical protein
LEHERALSSREADPVNIVDATMQSLETNQVERRIEVANNSPSLFKPQINGYTPHRNPTISGRTDLTAVTWHQPLHIERIWAVPLLRAGGANVAVETVAAVQSRAILRDSSMSVVNCIATSIA